MMTLIYVFIITMCVTLIVTHELKTLKSFVRPSNRNGIADGSKPQMSRVEESCRGTSTLLAVAFCHGLHNICGHHILRDSKTLDKLRVVKLISCLVEENTKYHVNVEHIQQNGTNHQSLVYNKTRE
jgi:hypothetical protein